MKYSDESWSGREERAIEYALDTVRRDYDQGWQGIEYKLNTVGSSRGDYPFVTVTLGLGTEQFEKMCTISLLEVHQGGQGKAGHKKPVLFPKIVFLYDKEIHGPGKCCEDIFEAGVECSSKTMYPDWLSMSGAGYISSMYRKYKKVISRWDAVLSLARGTSAEAWSRQMRTTNRSLSDVSTSEPFPFIFR